MRANRKTYSEPVAVEAEDDTGLFKLTHALFFQDAELLDTASVGCSVEEEDVESVLTREG